MDDGSNGPSFSPLLCFNANKIVSSGIWVGDRSVDFSLPLLLAQIALIFAATRITHFFLRPLGQPQVVSQVIAGIILGPSGLSRRNGSLMSKLFPPRSWIHLNCISLLSFILYIFIVAVKAEIRFTRKSSRKAFAISQASTIVPFLLVNHLSLNYFPYDSPADRSFFISALSGRWANTSHIVVSCILTELNLLTSKLGRLSMTASLIADLQCMIFKAMLAAFAATLPNFSLTLTVYSLAVLLCLVAIIVFVARPVVIWMIKRTPDGVPMDEGYLVTVVTMAVVCGLVGEVIGQHVAMGAMVLGLVLPGGPPLGTTLVDRMEKLMSGVFVPVYVAIAGLGMDVSTVGTGKVCWFTVTMIMASVAAKFAAVVVTGMYFRMVAKDAIVVALMLNCRGIIELYTFRAWQESQIADREMYAIQILSFLVVGGITPPIIKLIYNPSKHFTNLNKRRSIMQSNPAHELRILACAHEASNATPLISLLETCLPNPTCIYLLHLVPLIGTTHSVLVPYKPKQRRSSSQCSVTDHIVNAFKYLENCHYGHLTVQPFVGISPYTTMHDDICQLAFDKKIVMILLPFHRNLNLETGVVSANQSVRAVNVHVLHYAPCTVGIFLNYGIGAGSNFLRTVAVYFLGGDDDREALAYAWRMADNKAIGLTIIHLVPPANLRTQDDEEALDEAAVKEFRAINADNKRVKFREEEVKDGAEMIEVVRATSGEYSLVIVGRREGEKSRLTAGLEMWSEYPELGVLGDMLASTDFGGKVSTLVVQQRPTRSDGEI